MKDFVEMSNYEFHVNCFIMKDIKGLIYCCVGNKQILNFQDYIQTSTKKKGITYDIIEYQDDFEILPDKLIICFETVEEAFYFKLQVPEATFIKNVVRLSEKFYCDGEDGILLISNSLKEYKKIT